MRPDEKPEVRSTCWEEVDAAVDAGGFRAGFVEVFLEFRGAVLDDRPIDSRGRPEVVNASNFAKHFGIARSTFQRWLAEHGGDEFAGLAGAGSKEAKERKAKKAKARDRAAEAAEVRTKVAQTRSDYRDKLEVRRADTNYWAIDCQCLTEAELPPEAKNDAIIEWLAYLDEEMAAIEAARETLLAALQDEPAAESAA